MSPRGDSQHVVTVTGRVVLARAPVSAPNRERPCVYWDVRDGWSREPRERRAQDFWLEDERGRVLVIAEHLRADARAERSTQLLSAVEADLVTLGQRLRELKSQLRATQGPAAIPLHREREELARVATFLHKTRAHARGRVHGGGTLEEQERWLREHAEKITHAAGTRTVKLARDVWEVVIEPGERVTITGPCRDELLPPELSGDGGYRASASGRVLRGTADEPLLLVGLGARAPAAAPETGTEPRGPRSLAPRGARGPGASRRTWIAAVSALVVAVATALALLSER